MLTIGRIVHYTLSKQDVLLIGSQDRLGNHVAAGQVYPAVVVRVFDGGVGANLQVFLDGNDTYWATSRLKGEEPGTWAWPERVEG